MRLWFGGALGLASLLAIWFQHHREQAAHSVSAQYEQPGTNPPAGAHSPTVAGSGQQLAGGVTVQAGTPSGEGVPVAESPAARAERRKLAEELSLIHIYHLERHIKFRDVESIQFFSGFKMCIRDSDRVTTGIGT